jgi:uncharacterized protein YhfF
VKATALILDVKHRGRAVTADVPDGIRPLAALDRTSWPLGQRLTEGHAWYVFVEADAQPDHAWREDTALWKTYVEVALGGFEPARRDTDVWAFGTGPEQAARLAHHVIKGHKRATTGWVKSYEHDGDKQPVAGTISIVTDGFGIPLCVLETERVVYNTFAEATEEIAIGEAEGDTSIEDWREGHRKWFVTEGERIGVPFTDDAMLLHEYFRVVKVLQR